VDLRIVPPRSGELTSRRRSFQDPDTWRRVELAHVRARYTSVWPSAPQLATPARAARLTRFRACRPRPVRSTSEPRRILGQMLARKELPRPQASPPVVSAIDRIQHVLAHAGSPGTFATRHTAGTNDIFFDVAGVGAVSLPLSHRTADRLRAVAKPARYGLREKTLLDARVRDTWEIGRRQITSVLPLTHVTRRVGSPYTLVLAKTRALHARDAAERETWARDLAWLRESATRITQDRRAKPRRTATR